MFNTITRIRIFFKEYILLIYWTIPSSYIFILKFRYLENVDHNSCLVEIYLIFFRNNYNSIKIYLYCLLSNKINLEAMLKNCLIEILIYGWQFLYVLKLNKSFFFQCYFYIKYIILKHSHADISFQFVKHFSKILVKLL